MGKSREFEFNLSGQSTKTAFRESIQGSVEVDNNRSTLEVDFCIADKTFTPIAPQELRLQMQMPQVLYQN